MDEVEYTITPNITAPIDFTHISVQPSCGTKPPITFAINNLIGPTPTFITLKDQSLTFNE